MTYQSPFEIRGFTCTQKGSYYCIWTHETGASVHKRGSGWGSTYNRNSARPWIAVDADGNWLLDKTGEKPRTFASKEAAAKVLGL